MSSNEYRVRSTSVIRTTIKGTRCELWEHHALRRLTPAQAQALGLPVPDDAAQAAWVVRPHLWFVVHLRGAWRAAYRLIPRDGRPVVAELRVYPLLGDLPDLNPGEWAVEVRGFDTLEHVPDDGVTAGLLKDEVIPGKHIYDLLPRLVQRHGLRGLFEPWLRALGYNPDLKPHTPRRGPKGQPARDLAELAAFYLERCEFYDKLRETGGTSPGGKHPSPAKDTAEHFGLPGAGTARAALARARKRGLLVRTTGGRAGGRLTRRAEKLLREPAKKAATKKTATRKKKTATKTGGNR